MMATGQCHTCTRLLLQSLILLPDGLSRKIACGAENVSSKCGVSGRSSCKVLMWLQALGAEVIVTFEGTSESGAQFMTRQSYLPSEMHWGYVFSEIIFHAKEGETEHIVDISRSALLACYFSMCLQQVVFSPPGACTALIVYFVWTPS